MSNKGDERPTPLESLVMQSLWERSPASVRDVQMRLSEQKPMAYNTVLTLMRRLRKKGFLASERNGRRDLYSPVVERQVVAQRSLRDLVDRFYQGSATSLVAQLLRTEDLAAHEVIALRQELDRWLRSRSVEEGGANGPSR